jgi:hypothetical protein
MEAANYSKGSTMEAENHVKYGTNSKSLKSRCIILLVILLLPISLAAQITFAEKQQEKVPDWKYMKDIIMMPYDSTQLLIETYPILEAYKKYIGQQLFFMKGSDSDENIVHKYYEIVDVLSYKNFLEIELQREETKFREKEKELREKEREAHERENEVRKELLQDFAIQDSVYLIDYELHKITEKRKGKVSRKEEKELNEREVILRDKKEKLQQGYKRKDEIGGDFFERKEISERGFLVQSERDKESRARTKTLNRIVGNESENIKKGLEEIEKYFKESKLRKERATYKIRYQQKKYFFPCEGNPGSQCSYEIKGEDIPYFVLKNTNSKDTIYRIIPTVNYVERNNRDDYRAKDYDSGIILVGGFVKLKEVAIGQNFVFWHHPIATSPEIASTWECIDVSITKEQSYLRYYDDKSSYSRDENKSEIVSLTLRNKKKSDLIDYVRYSHITQRAGNHIIGSTSSTITSEKTFKEHELAFNRRKQDYNNLVAQEKAKLKQQLTAKYGAANADKIIAGKFEIGMNKAVCKEIAGYATIVDKTTTTETWKVSNFWIGSVTYLYFNSNKLVRILNR